MTQWTMAGMWRTDVEREVGLEVKASAKVAR